MTLDYYPSFRIILLGDVGVGRLSLLSSFKERVGTNKNRRIVPHNLVNSPPDILTSEMFKSDGKSVMLNIWKVGGHGRSVWDRNRFVIKNASGAMIIYDITRRKTFGTIYQLFSMFDKDVVVILLGNKSDHTDRREVAREEGEKLASELGVKFMETSARQCINLEEAFTVLTRDMMFKGYEKLLLRPLVDPSGTVERPHGMDLTVHNILKHGVENNYHIRVMVVGNENVGKSTLGRRILKRRVNLKTYKSTNGIDVYIQSCDVDIETGVWNIHRPRKTGVIEQLRRRFGGKDRNEPVSMRELAK